MKWVFAGAIAVLALLSVVAYSGSHEPVAEGKTRLLWVSDDNPVRRGQIDLFNKLHPDIELKLDPTNAGMEKVIVQCLGGVGPDLFDCYDGFQLSAYVKSGIAKDVTRQMLSAGIDVPNIIWPCVAPNCILDNRVYGSPNNAALDCIWLNKDVFDQTGVPYPTGFTSWDELIALGQKLTKRDENGRAKQFGLLADWWEWKDFVVMFGGRIYNDDGSRCTVDSPQAIAGVQLIRDLIYQYKIMPSPVEEAAAAQGGWGAGTITFFSGGKGAMALGGRWWLCTLRQTKGLKLGAVAPPFGPSGQFRGYGRATLMNAAGRHQKQALEFLKYLAGQPYNELLNDQADALAPVKQWSYSDRFLHNPEHPEEDYNATWRDVMAYGVADQISPYINGNVANRILDKQLDLVKSDLKDPAEALKTAAAQINEEIDRNRAKTAGRAAK
jgi:ABC-type glycerol-3-phosphate transport system substrate-binding protein